MVAIMLDFFVAIEFYPLIQNSIFLSHLGSFILVIVHKARRILLLDDYRDDDQRNSEEYIIIITLLRAA